ncbi:hypothetical protein AAG906_010729 [Vitis piasezkii]
MDAGGLHKLPQSSAAPSRSSVTPLRHLPSSHEGGSSLDPSTTGVTVTAWADARGPEEGGCERCLVVPTKHTIRMTLYWLVQGCQPGDSMVFHVSGRRIYITRCLAPWISKLREGLWMMKSTQRLLDPQMSPLNRSMYRCRLS